MLQFRVPEVAQLEEHKSDGDSRHQLLIQIDLWHEVAPDAQE